MQIEFSDVHAPKDGTKFTISCSEHPEICEYYGVTQLPAIVRQKMRTFYVMPQHSRLDQDTITDFSRRGFQDSMIQMAMTLPEERDLLYRYTHRFQLLMEGINNFYHVSLKPRIGRHLREKFGVKSLEIHRETLKVGLYVVVLYTVTVSLVVIYMCLHRQKRIDLVKKIQ